MGLIGELSTGINTLTGLFRWGLFEKISIKAESISDGVPRSRFNDIEVKEYTVKFLFKNNEGDTCFFEVETNPPSIIKTSCDLKTKKGDSMRKEFSFLLTNEERKELKGFIFRHTREAIFVSKPIDKTRAI